MSKISNEIGKIDDFRGLARKLSFLPAELDIFDIRQHYVRILYIYLSTSDLLSLIISNAGKHDIAVYGKGLALLTTS